MRSALRRDGARTSEGMVTTPLIASLEKPCASRRPTHLGDWHHSCGPSINPGGGPWACTWCNRSRVVATSASTMAVQQMLHGG
jgi:hypothetical protein